MRATLLKTVKHPSKYGGTFYYLFFKGEDGRSYRTCLYPHYGNFKRWQQVIGKDGIVLDGLFAKGNLINADSFPKIVEVEKDAL